MKPFVAGCIGGAAGALVAGIFGIGATAYGITGIFGFLITTHYTVQYAIVMLVAAVVAFIISWSLYREKEPALVEGDSTRENATDNNTDSEPNTVYSPINGEGIELEKVNDESFASGALGKGFAIVPSEGKVYAPFDGSMTIVYDTKHLLAMTSNDGVELFVHIGLNTVELKGQYYTEHVKAGDTIKKGQLLMEFDIPKIKEAGYDLTTPVIVTNSDSYQEVNVMKYGAIAAEEKAIVVK